MEIQSLEETTHFAKMSFYVKPIIRHICTHAHIDTNFISLSGRSISHMMYVFFTAQGLMYVTVVLCARMGSDFIFQGTSQTQGYKSWSEKACSQNKIGNTSFLLKLQLTSLQSIHSQSENLCCKLLCKPILSCKLLQCALPALVDSLLLSLSNTQPSWGS